MAPQNGLSALPVHSAPAGTRMLQGVGIALLFISMLLLSAGDSPDADWHSLWFIKPLLITPLAGALGGAFYYFMDHLRYKGGWRRALAYVLSLLGFCIILWLGVVLGLNGTLWD